MAFDMTNLNSILPSIGDSIVNGLYIGGAFLGVYLAFFFIRRTKKYNYTVRIFNKDATGNIVQLPDDKGGIFLDRKTQYRLFMLKRNKFGLDPDEIPYILTSRGSKLVYLIQTGLKNFQFMRPVISDNPGLVFNVQDEDIAWGLNAYERQKKIFQNDFMTKIMPFIGMAFVFLVIVMSLWFIFKNFGVITETANAFNQAAATMRETAAMQNLGAVVQ